MMPDAAYEELSMEEEGVASEDGPIPIQKLEVSINHFFDTM